MHITASPGPDGFGPGFYKSTWNITKPDICALFDDFHNRTADLERINRFFIVLLPKKEVARKPKAFSPISLQNCPVKAVTKRCLLCVYNHTLPL